MILIQNLLGTIFYKAMTQIHMPLWCTGPLHKSLCLCGGLIPYTNPYTSGGLLSPIQIHILLGWHCPYTNPNTSRV